MITSFALGALSAMVVIAVWEYRQARQASIAQSITRWNELVSMETPSDEGKEDTMWGEIRQIEATLRKRGLRHNVDY